MHFGLLERVLRISWPASWAPLGARSVATVHKEPTMKKYLVLIAFLTTISGFKLQDDVLKNYSEFFNFGSKKSTRKLEMDKYENSIFKSKVDILGSVFKINVDALKFSGILDLVFLIDASSSVGEYNFKSELKFVKKLLSDVTVDFNHTRVALVTFSSQNNIITNIDEISTPKEANNKCLLLNNEINSISYTGGGTYTLGAFKRAQEIFKNSRKEAKKVLFLITDGFSNGGDPVPIANELKQSQVTIFTIGIINGNYKELYELSTRPGELYSYLLDSYEEFEGLARRALHVDLQSGDYIPLGTNGPCNTLCEEETECCDKNALCTCGTSTGHFTCLCQPGFYGSGLKNSCSPCPSGTYANGPNVCMPCPDIHHYTKPPAIGIESCSCKPGYRATDNIACEVITCPKLTPPENGYFVNRKECGNVLNTACGVRCNVGYSLNGSSIRLCQANGTWSGQEASCQVKTCKKLPQPLHGSMSCKHMDLNDELFSMEGLYLPVDTVCSFSCERGRTLVGSSQRSCLPLAQWDGLKSSCRQIKCNKLSKVNYGEVEPKTCTLGKQPFGKKCNITCNDGFKLTGPSQKICNGQHGSWNTPEEYFCKDVIKPKIKCPKNIKGKSLPGKDYGTVDWEQPDVTDNSGLNITVWTKPAIKSVSNFSFAIGKTNVTYFAQDASGNKAKCVFTVEIEDKEAPVIEGCIDPPPFLVFTKEADNITWDDPVIYDNSKHVTINQSREFGAFEIGTSQIIYNAIDPSGNANECILNITLQEPKCEELQDPIFGHSECKPQSDSIHCVVTCEEGYALPLPAILSSEGDTNFTKLICQHSDPIWYSSKETGKNLLGEGSSFPDCSITEIPTEINQSGIVQLEPATPEVCQNITQLKEIGNEIKTTLQNVLLSNCTTEDCKIQTEANCVEQIIEKEEEITNIIKRHVKREIGENKHKKKKKRINVKFHLQLRNKATRLLSNNELQQNGNFTITFSKPEILCPVGSLSRKYKCIRCPQGTFHNSTSNSCQSCPIGTYNSRSGSTQCLKCPVFHSTRKLHAKSPKDCVEQCPPGHYARKKQIKRPKHHPNAIIERITLKPYCSSCALGYYQDEYNQLSCKLCPEGMTTFSRGSRRCAAKLSTVCANEHICGFNGVCVMENEFYYSCKCSDNYVGAHCETKINFCASNPCQNNATCVQTPENYKCNCLEGFMGKNCTEYTEKCPLNCLNGGKCLTTEENENICVCTQNYNGKYCETKLSFCTENLCENSAMCEELEGGYYCRCLNGYIGKRCNYLPCDYQPCNSMEICSNLHENVTTRLSYKCNCPFGYIGSNCAEKINFCATNQCRNNGKCVSNDNGFTCECKNGYKGENCQLKLSGDYVLNFPRSTVTDYVPLDGFKEDLQQISVCLWMLTEDSFNYGTILSYATQEFDNAFTITDYTGLVLYVNNKYAVTDVLLNDGNWHHLCVTWTSAGGNYTIFIDGKAIYSGSNLSSSNSIKAKGKLIIGQEQDIMGGKFSQSESFLGQMAHLDMYNRVLTENDVNLIMDSCSEEFYGDLYAWPELGEFIRGDIQIINSTFCVQCPEPEPLYNGNVYVEENTAYYSCNAGFELSESKFVSGRKCSKAANWEGNEDPYCKPVVCGHPGYVPNGYVIGRSYSYLDEVEYKCNYGFNMSGESVRLCWSNATWIPEAPKCLGVQCNVLALPKHSSATVFIEDDVEIPYEEYLTSSGIDVNVQVEVKCHDNATLEGEASLTCLPNGSWDYPIPKCIVKKHLTCSLDYIPKAPDNGYLLESTLDEVKLGKSSFIEYKCRPGYKISGVNMSECIIDGYWSELNMECKPQTCGEPPKYQRMILKPTAGQQTQYQIGNMITYECIRGHKAFGNAKLRCLMPGIWSKMQSTCTRISCGKPTVKASTKMRGNYLYNDKVMLTCGNGEMKEIICGSDGKWLGDYGTC